MTMQNRAIEEVRRKCRQRWVEERRLWRMWRHLNHDRQGSAERAELSVEVRCRESARTRMREAAAARMSTAARATRAEANSSCPAHGSASFRWIAEPTRAGWWWFDRGGIHVCGNPAPLRVIDGAWITSETEMRWLEVVDPDDGRMTLGRHESKWPEGRWAGPINPPPARNEEPTPNDQSAATGAGKP